MEHQRKRLGISSWHTEAQILSFILQWHAMMLQRVFKFVRIVHSNERLSDSKGEKNGRQLRQKK